MDVNFRNQSKNNQLTVKLIVLAVLVFVSWVGSFFVWGLIQEREHRQETASADVAEQWSRAQLIAGPVLTIPVEKTSVTSAGERIVNTNTLFLLPMELSYKSDVETEVRTRGVYETPVYTATIEGLGTFDLGDIEIESSADTRILWDKAVLSVNVSDTRGIASPVDLAWNDRQYPFSPSSQFTALDENGIHTSVEVEPNQPNYSFAFEIPLRGSREISFLPLSENTSVSVHSDWNAPSFTGKFLPEQREISETGFSADWKVASFGKNAPQYWMSNSAVVTNESLASKSFGVGLYQEVDFYTMVNRSTKYSILFISLTFLTFFMYEVLAGLRIHPIQYLLVGLAVALFYLLLLSFAEIIGFLPAYLVSTVAITALITGYCFSILKAKKRAFSITVLLIALYTYLYILLQLEEYSLLFGSILLFGVLGTVMYLTRNLDWYSPKKPE